MSEINSRNLLEYDSIPTYISPTKFKYFLQCLFNTIMGDEEKITKNVFYKLFPSFPYFAKKKLFSYFIDYNNNNKSEILSEDLIDYITKIIFGNINYKLEFLSNFFLFNKDNFITYEDLRLYFYHFYIFSLQENLLSLDIILGNLFSDNKKKITKQSFQQIIQFQNSDIFFLFYFLFNKCIFNKYDMILFNNKLTLKNEKEDNFQYENLYDFYMIISPTIELFTYINNNYGLNLEYENDDKEEYELDELNAFENDFKKCRESILTQKNIIENDNSFRKSSYQSQKITKNKNKSLKFFPNSSENVLAFRSASPDTKLGVSRLKTFYNHFPSKKNSLFNYEQNTSRREDITNISILIKNTLILCKAHFTENFLLIKYINEKNKYVYLIIPLSFSFPIKKDNNKLEINYSYGDKNNKNIEYDISDYTFEVKIVNQTFKKEKNFIFLFPTNSKRNMFYNEIKRYSNYIEIKEKYNLIEQIGKGGFGQTYISTKKQDRLNSFISETYSNRKSEKYAIKIINKLKKRANDPNETFDRNEIEINKILVHINNPNIIKIYEVLEDIENIYFIMEYCPITYKETINLSYEIKLNQIKQVIKAINFLHSIGIMHRDLKPGNVLLGGDGNFKIIDFGFADLFSPFEKSNESLGSVGFFPPEVLCKKEYNFNIEYWNIGVMSYYYLFNELPFGMNGKIDVIKNINIEEIILKRETEFNQKFYKFIHILGKITIDCLKLDINERGKNLDKIIMEEI